MNEEKYITIKELAELKGVSTRTIRMSKGKYITREITVKGGKSFEILLSSIEPELQEKYYSKVIPTFEVKRLPAPTDFHKPDKAKVIERFFLEMQESFEKLLPSYIGTNIENKPARLRRNEKFHSDIHQEFVPTIQQTIQMINSWLEYKHSLPCPNDRSKSIKEMLDSIERQEINPRELDDLMLAQEIKTITSQGIRFLKSDYYNDALYGLRQKVIIKYSLFDLSYINVYTISGKFLCRADRITLTHPLAHYTGEINDIEDYKQKIQKQKQLKNKTIKACKEFLNIGLVYGNAGLGKTKTALYLSIQYDAVYLRATNAMSPKWMLEEIAKELDEIPRFYTADIFRQCVNALKNNPQMIIVDEIDYLLADFRTIETLRDLHDETGVPIILIGMQLAKHKLKKHTHLFDRISEIYNFTEFEYSDMKQITEELSEVEMTKEAVHLIHNKAKSFRQIVNTIDTFEKVALANGLTQIDENIAQEIIYG